MASNEPLSLRQSALWVVGCRVVGILATLAGHILVARLLDDPAQFGWYLIATTVIAVGAILGMVGLNETGLRLIAECLARGDLPGATGYARASLRIVLLASLLVAMTIGLALTFVFPPSRQPLLAGALVALGILLMASQQLAAELVRGFGELRIASLFSGGQSGGPLTNLVFLAALTAVWASGLRPSALLVTGLLVGAACLTWPLSLAGLLHTVRGAAQPTDYMPASYSQPRLGELLSISLFLLANQALSFVSQQADLWIAGGLLPADEVGLLGAAKRSVLVVAMPVQMATLTVVATIPRLHAQSQTAELEKLARSAATAAAIPALIAVAVMAIIPATFISSILGEAYAGGSTALLVLLIGHVVLVVSGNPQHLLIMTGRHRAVLAVNVLSAIILVVAGIVLARLWGMVGLAAASAGSLALFNGLLWWIAHRELNVWTHIGWPRSSAMHRAESPGELSAAANGAALPEPASSPV